MMRASSSFDEMSASTNSTIALLPSTHIFLVFLMCLVAFAIMLGNAVVILAFVVDQKLRHRSNYFFLNLAIADFFVGMISIPLYIPHTLYGWSSESKFCVFWLIVDYLLCTTSVYNIVLISYDRYQSVSNAISYRTQHIGILKIIALMVAVWVLAFLVHGPIILVSESWNNSSVRVSEKKDCEPGFISKWYILAITSFLEFVVPVLSVAYFNIYIYWRLWKRGNLSRWQSQPGLTSPTPPNNCGPSLRGGLHGRKRSLLARKLAKSLAILLGVFAFCWAPYSLFTIIRSFLSPEQRPQTIWYEITFWLQWFNSLVNPFLYPLCHKHFQKAFLRIFHVKKQPILTQNRSMSS
uniref:Histamine receptor H4 n=1 Tax=Lynx canadensis TaxID=61383 RepID=A0A667IG32_LYNCA